MWKDPFPLSRLAATVAVGFVVGHVAVKWIEKAAYVAANSNGGLW